MRCIKGVSRWSVTQWSGRHQQIRAQNRTRTSEMRCGRPLSLTGHIATGTYYIRRYQLKVRYKRIERENDFRESCAPLINSWQRSFALQVTRSQVPEYNKKKKTTAATITTSIFYKTKKPATAAATAKPTAPERKTSALPS
jgi:hypothetical protein